MPYEVPYEVPPMPSYQNVVEMMYDQKLDAFAAGVVRVIYSKIIYLSKNGNNLLTNNKKCDILME